MRLRIDKGNNPGKVISLTDMVFTIGRELDNQFVINESGVSRHHCTISRVGQEWFVEDRNSVNGVLVNGQRISNGTALHPGDRITVFNHEFTFLDDHNDAPPTPHKVSIVSDVASDKAAFPWGKMILLVVILAVVVYLAIKVFTPDAEPADSSPAVTVEKADLPDLSPAPASTDTALPFKNDSAQASRISVPQDVVTSPVQTSSTSTFSTPLPASIDEAPNSSALVSDVIIVDSDPAGAEVYLDGELQTGSTPLLIRQVSRGRHSLELRKTGYENSQRTIMVPDVQPSRAIVLRQKAGTLLLQSNPSGAHVWKERQFFGVTPLLLDGLEAGKHEFTIRGPGCETKKESVEVSATRGVQSVVELQSNLGSLEVVTQPGNCKVYLQGSLMGVTSEQAGQSKSQPLLLENIIAGEQRMKIEHSSGFSVSGQIQVPRNETVQKNIVLRVPTHQVQLNSGEIFSGMLLEQNEQGDIVLEDLSKKATRFLKPQIKELRLLSDTEIQEAVSSFRKTPGRDSEGARGDTLSVNDLRRAMLSMPAEDFNRANAGKVYNLIGRPTMILPESKGITVIMFTASLRCQFNNLSKYDIEEINADNNANISFQGTCVGVGKDGIMLLKNCILLSEF